jgi:hypothetical protein
MNLLEDSQAQWQAVADFFDGLGLRMDRMPVVAAGMAQPAVGDNAEQKKKEGEPA